MTREELEKATGQELIEQRDYCGVDGYYGDYLDNVNAEMLKRFNRLADLENKIADIKAKCDLAIEGRDVKIKELELELTVEKDQHQEEINLHLHAEDYIKELEKDIEYLKACKQKIIDLQKENEELKHNKKTVVHLADCLEEKMKERIEELERLNSNQAESLRVTMLEEEKKGKRIEELEKENAELKAEIENDRDLPTVAYMQGAENQKKKDEKQLTKAKEIIKGLLPMASNFVFGTLPKLDEEVQLYRKAEQFIKEIE